MTPSGRAGGAAAAAGGTKREARLGLGGPPQLRTFECALMHNGSGRRKSQPEAAALSDCRSPSPRDRVVTGRLSACPVTMALLSSLTGSRGVSVNTGPVPAGPHWQPTTPFRVPVRGADPDIYAAEGHCFSKRGPRRPCASVPLSAHTDHRSLLVRRGPTWRGPGTLARAIFGGQGTTHGRIWNRPPSGMARC